MIEKINFASSCAMLGIIWLVQVLVYPAFQFVRADDFKSFHDHHMKKISIVVGPLMLIELGASFLWFLENKNELQPQVSFFSVVLLWILTALVASPLHSQLQKKGYDKAVVSQLIATNWTRTLLWTLRFGIVWSVLD